MAAPSLSEFTSIQPRDTGKPAVVIDNSQMVAQLNQNAKFKAENDWRKYKTFLDNLNTISQDAQAIAGLETMPQDREYLDKQRGEIFNIISKNPRSLSGVGPDALKVQQGLAKYRSDATRSKQDYAFDWAHRQLLGQNPEWSSDENKKVIDNFASQPLGERKQYNLNMPQIVDMGKLLEGVFKDPTVSRTAYGWETTPDGKFIQETTKTELNHDAFMNRWNAGLSYQTDKYGRPIAGYAKQLFDQLPDNKKKAYLNDNGQPNIPKFWHDVGETMFGSKEDIVKSEKGKLEPNRFALNEQKFGEDLKKMFTKFGYDKILTAMREGSRETYALFLRDNGLNKPGSSGKAINDMTVGKIKYAQAHGRTERFADASREDSPTDASRDGSPEREMILSPDDKAMLTEYSTSVLGKKVPEVPSTSFVDAQGNIRLVYYKKGTNQVEHTEKITPDQYREAFANKYKLTSGLSAANEDLFNDFGAPTLNGNVDAYYEKRFAGNKDESGTTDRTDDRKENKDKKTTVESLRIKYKY